MKALTWICTYCLILIALLWAPPGYAHLQQGTLGRHLEIISMADIADNSAPNSQLRQNIGGHQGVVLAIRVTGNLAYIAALSEAQQQNITPSLPYLKIMMKQGQAYYQLDQAKIIQDPVGFASYLSQMFAYEADQQIVQPDWMMAKFYPAMDHPNWTKISDIVKDFETDQSSFAESYISDSHFDLLLGFSHIRPDQILKVRATADPAIIPPELPTQTFLVDHRTIPAFTHQYWGFFERDMIFDQFAEPDRLSDFGEHIYQGIIHILIGWDHVLFVLSLIILVGAQRSLIWVVSGFSIGHSGTMFLGQVTFLSELDWFVAIIEILIAGSIIITAGLAMMRKGHVSAGYPWKITLTSLALGALHGFGFSFVFADLYALAQSDITTLILTLLGFNIGLEIGQLAIILVVLGSWWLGQKIIRDSYLSAQKLTVGRYWVAFSILSIACYWCVDRLIQSYGLLFS